MFYDRHVLGCSAEGHVSRVYSERMSSCPMEWSETGSDRMYRLRCFIRNYGLERVVELVNYRRERELSAMGSTGTDGMVDEPQRKTIYPETEGSPEIRGSFAWNDFLEFYGTIDPCYQGTDRKYIKLKKRVFSCMIEKISLEPFSLRNTLFHVN